MSAFTQVVSFKDCWQKSLEKNEDLKVKNEEWQQSKERKIQGFSAFLPTLSGVWTQQRQDVSGLNDAQRKSFPDSQTVTKLTAQQSLFHGMKDYYTWQQADKMEQAAGPALDSARLKLRGDLAQTYYQVLSYERDLKNADIEIDLYQKRIKELTSRVAIGRSRQVEVLTVQYSLTALQAQQEQLSSQLKLAREALAKLTGLPVDGLYADNAIPPENLPSLDSYLSKLEVRPDIKGQRSQVAAYEDGVAIARSGHLPSFDIVGNYYLHRPDSQKAIDWDVQLALTIPLFSGNAVQSKLRETVSQRTQQEWLLRKKVEDAQNEIRSTYQAVQSDFRQLQTLKEALDLADRTYRIQEKDYRVGLVTNLEVLQALANLHEAHRSYDRTFYNTIVDHLKLQIAVGEME